jgi:NAD(P)H-dependent FMN reductase
MKFLALAASHRPESLNLKLAQLAVKNMRALGAEVELASYCEFDMESYNDIYADNQPETTKSFAKKMQGIDGIIISIPEYNWSFPGSLKNIIDWTSLIKPNPLAGKTALLMSATTGARGGITGLQQFKSPLEAQHMFVFHKVFPLAHAQNAFNSSGEFIDKAQQELFFNMTNDYINFTRKISDK